MVNDCGLTLWVRLWELTERKGTNDENKVLSGDDTELNLFFAA